MPIVACEPVRYSSTMSRCIAYPKAALHPRDLLADNLPRADVVAAPPGSVPGHAPIPEPSEHDAETRRGGRDERGHITYEFVKSKKFLDSGIVV